MLGFGVFQIPPEDTERCVREAIDAGYRSIDTAQAYNNEEGVGKAIKKCGVKREELFVTTKVWMANAGEEKARTSIESSLKKLRTEYADLLLIHLPFNDYYGIWRALEDTVSKGQARAIGISNFYPDRMIDLAHHAEIKPQVDQVEAHVFQQQKIVRAYARKYGIQIESWAPFVQGKNEFFSNPLLKAIGEKHSKSVAQIALRFLIQLGFVVIPKSVRKERMKENLGVFDFNLEVADMENIKTLDRGESILFSHDDPATVERYMNLKR